MKYLIVVTRFGYVIKIDVTNIPLGKEMSIIQLDDDDEVVAISMMEV